MSAEDAVKERLKVFQKAYVKTSFAKGEGFYDMYKEFCIDEFQIIRPSGNPLQKEGWHNMMSSQDIIFVKPDQNKLVSIDSCIVFANDKAAVTTHTGDFCFEYKGQLNEDRAKISITWGLEVVEEEEKWKMVHWHRASGQPIPKEE